MAITIIDQPTRFAKVGQKLIVMASSTNVGQHNFRYVVELVDSAGNVFVSDILVPPNPVNALVFDASHICLPFVPVKVVNGTSENYINPSGLSFNTQFLNCINQFKINIYEGYDVDGVFTVDAESKVQTELLTIINAKYKVLDGYKPDPNLVYSFTSTTSLLLGGRNTQTHTPTEFPIGAATTSNQIVWIPVRRSELDYGTISYIPVGNDTYLTSTSFPTIRMTIYDSSGAPTTTYNQSNVYLDLNFKGVYPANLNAHGMLLRPSEYPNWRWYDIAMYDSTNTTRKSVIYRFYPVDDDCRFDNIRLAWWHPINGGFDFFNFEKKNEESIEVERKRVKKVVGTYASDTFSFNTFDSELAEGLVNRMDYININSGWLQDGEFELLKSLIASPLVYIVKDDGSLVPVLVEENNYTARKIREAKQYNYSMRLRYSQQYM